MSTFIIHLLIPILVVAALGIVRHRDAWAWSWPAWAVDIDYLGWIAHVKWGVPNVHRALFHNVWWLFLAVGLAFWAGRRWMRRTGGTPAEFVRARPGWALVPYFYASHLVLDLFQGGISAFWPLSPRNFFWWFQLNVDTTKPIPEPRVHSETGIEPGVVDVSAIYTWLDSEQFAILVLYLIGLGLMFSYERAARSFPPAMPRRRPPARP